MSEWIKLIAPTNLQKVRTLQINLDEGEAQAIALALKMNCDLLLMDERIGTSIARQEGLRTIEIVGVLIKAKEEQIIFQASTMLFLNRFLHLKHYAKNFLESAQKNLIFILNPSFKKGRTLQSARR